MYYNFSYFIEFQLLYWMMNHDNLF